MKGFGTFALIVGVCWLIFALSMDVSVPTGAGGRVNNLGLMADRQVHTMVGGLLAVAGLLMVLLGGRGPATNSAVEADTRPCPLCAEIIKNAAIRCRHCGADVEAIASSGTTDQKVQNSSSNRPFIAICAALVALIIGGVAYRMIPAPPASKALVPANTYRPKADELIGLNPSAFGCVSETNFSQSLYHYNRSEFTAWTDRTKGADCFHQRDVNPGVTWTVLQIRDDLMQVGLKQASEYSKNPEVGRFSYWTLERWAEQRSSIPK
jgi:hypothetical protein